MENLKQVELAKATLQVFKDRGENMTDVRNVIHYFYNGNAAALSNALGELGYQVRPMVNNDGVVAERNEAIGEEWRTSTLVHLCELADTYGAEYDGWEASMERQQSEPTAKRATKKPSGWLSKVFGKKD